MSTFLCFLCFYRTFQPPASIVKFFFTHCWTACNVFLFTQQLIHWTNCCFTHLFKHTSPTPLSFSRLFSFSPFRQSHKPFHQFHQPIFSFTPFSANLLVILLFPSDTNTHTHTHPNQTHIDPTVLAHPHTFYLINDWVDFSLHKPTPNSRTMPCHTLNKVHFHTHLIC